MLLISLILRERFIVTFYGTLFQLNQVIIWQIITHFYLVGFVIFGVLLSLRRPDLFFVLQSVGADRLTATLSTLNGQSVAQVYYAKSRVKLKGISKMRNFHKVN